MTHTATGGSRAAQQEQAISETVLQLLREGGYAALTTDAVANRAGVSKATIYKTHSSKSELLTAAASLVLSAPTIQDLGSFRAEIEQLLRERAQQYNGEVGGHLFAALLGTTAQDPEFRPAFAEWIKVQQDANVNAVRRGISRGEIRPDCDPKAISTLIAAPLLYRMLVERAPVDEALIGLVIDSVMAGVASRA